MAHWILEGHEIKPAELMKWARWFESVGDGRVVAKTDIGHIHISTVFLGIDHRIGEPGPPLVFESMVFGGPLDGEQERYCTWDESVHGHDVLVKRVEAAMDLS